MAEFTGKGCSVEIDPKGSVRAFKLAGRTFEPPMGYTLFELNGKFATAEPLDGGDLALAADGGLSGVLSFASGDEVGLEFKADEGSAVETVGIVVPLPDDAEVHLLEGTNLGRKIDSDMPVGHEHSARLGCNFLLVRAGGMWIRLLARADDGIERRHSASASVSRHPGLFIVTFGWKASDDVTVGVFPTMEAAVADFEGWVDRTLGVRKLADDPAVPDWVHKVRLVLIIDMMRSDGETSHDYADVARLAADLGDAGCPKDTLVYLPGWNGPYDAMYPTYRPHPELGGEEGFRRMIESMHANGLRAMVHTNPWGVDPFHPEIERYLPYCVKDKDGRYAGFQTPSLTRWGIAAPPRRILKWRTGEVHVGAPRGAASFAFDTVGVPDKCEAVMTFGGVASAKARLRITITRRSQVTPEGAFADGGECMLPFRFLLWPGANRVELELVGADGVDLSGCWYRIDECSMPPDPYGTWTYPILFADTTNPEWIEIFVRKVAEAVETYGIDAIHCDATEYEWNKAVYEALERRLPGLPKSGEGFATLSAFGYWTFCQTGAGQSLTAHLEAARGTREQGSLPDTSELGEALAWLDKESEVARLVGDYIRVYPHLCGANAFVPVGKVCNTSPARLVPRNKDALRKVLRDAERLAILPALRLNHRRHGLDAESKKAIREIAARSRD
jgi:hypothetical protein